MNVVSGLVTKKVLDEHVSILRFFANHDVSVTLLIRFVGTVSSKVYTNANFNFDIDYN